jgi:DNA-binding Lrp family transcriptional regulator
MTTGTHDLDALDVSLIEALVGHPRAGALELSRQLSVARATVQARLQRLEDAGVITGYGPDLDLRRAGYPVHAYVTLQIAQGRLDDVAGELAAVPGIIEAYATTGDADVLCRLAATSHEDLQEILLELNRLASVVRSTSVITLSVVVPPRILPLLKNRPHIGSARAPAYRSAPPAADE